MASLEDIERQLNQLRDDARAVSLDQAEKWDGAECVHFIREVRWCREALAALEQRFASRFG